MVFGDDYKNLNLTRNSLIRLIARNLIDISSEGYAEEYTSPKTAEGIKTRGREYIDYLLTT